MLETIRNLFGGRALDPRLRSPHAAVRAEGLAATRAAASAALEADEARAHQLLEEARERHRTIMASADELADGRRRECATAIAAWWNQTMDALLAEWRERDRPGVLTEQIRATWLELVRRCADELAAEPSRTLIGYAIASASIERAPGLGRANFGSAVHAAALGLLAQNVARAANAPIAFADALRALESQIELDTINTLGTDHAPAEARARFAVGRGCVTSSDLDRSLRAFDADAAELRQREIAAQQEERHRKLARRFPDGWIIGSGGPQARRGGRELVDVDDDDAVDDDAA